MRKIVSLFVAAFGVAFSAGHAVGGPSGSAAPATTPPPGATAGGIRVSTADHKAQGPEIAIGPDGSINMIWIDESTAPEHSDSTSHGHSHQSSTNLYFTRSSDGGATYAPPRRINGKEGDVWGFWVSKPKISVGRNGTIHVFYPANDRNPTNGKPEAVALYTRSTDGGRTFATPVRLNTMGTTDAEHVVHGGLTHAHVFGTMAVDSRGSVYTFWIDTRDMAREGDQGKVFMAVSRDDGRSWGKDTELFPADVCPCCQVTAFVDAKDRIYVGSRQVDAGYRDSTIAVSRDGGRTFGPRARIVGNRWKIDACPLKPTAIAADGDDVYAAYFTGGENPQGVYFVRSGDGGRRWSTPMPVHPGAAVSDAPVLALAGSTLHLFWHAKLDGARRIFTRASTDGGRTFGAPTEIPAPEGAAQLPAVAVRADGGVQLAWQHGSEVRALRWDGTGPERRLATAAAR
jgi:hypothetical protein